MKNIENLGKHPETDAEGVEIREVKGHQLAVVTVTSVETVNMIGLSDGGLETVNLGAVATDEEATAEYIKTGDGYAPFDEYVEALEPTKEFQRAADEEEKAGEE